VTISIIVPCFNADKYIASALHSIEGLTIPPDEVIIIDDGSTDLSRQIAEKYVVRNKNWKLIATLNNGQGNARNLGIIVSRCEYIYFFDSDDIVEPSLIEKFKFWVQSYDRPDLMLFSGSAFFEEGVGAEKLGNYLRSFSLPPSSPNEVAKYFLSCKSYSASPCLYISRRMLWINENVRFGSYFYEDEGAFLLLLNSASCVVVSNDVLFHRRIRALSTMTSPVTDWHTRGDRANILIAFQLIKFGGQSHEFDALLRKRVGNYVKRYISNSIKIRGRIDFKLIATLIFSTCWLVTLRGLVAGLIISNSFSGMRAINSKTILK
jgi:glycosyltransferase involved in cell wall biosynthesis